MTTNTKPMYFREKIFKSRTARIGRYLNSVQSPLFGKYYVDIQSTFGSANQGTPESFPTYEEAAFYLVDRGFEPVE